MNDMAEIFWTGRNQAVRLPEEYRFEGTEVRIRREGNSVILEAADAVDEATGLPAQRLREMIQQGIDSGPSEPWDVEEIKRLGRERLARRR